MLLIKLVLAHLIGDFLLQPYAWVLAKRARKIKAAQLYLHCLVHGVLVMAFLWDLNYWPLVLLVMVIHGLIDILKLYAQRPENGTAWFLVDQAFHLGSLVALWIVWEKLAADVAVWLENPLFWLYLTSLIFLTVAVGMTIQVVMANWTREIAKEQGKSLAEAGRFIGFLERILTFIFIVTDHWEGVGFLLAAKSVFRFGDLKESKDRKLTEYILIGTMLSFGIAILMGVLVAWLSTHLSIEPK